MVHAVDATVADLADRLWRAEAERVAVPPLTADLPDLTIDDAYAIQTRNIDRRVDSGAVVRGRKVGLTSRPVQDLLGVHEPNFGVLLDDMDRKVEAMAAYQLALRGDPALADCHYNLALLYEELERPKDAIRHMAQYRRLVAGKPSH
jgi:2-keto-4-pentenoate hydratase